MFTAFENVEFPLLLQGVRSSERRKRVLEALESVGLAARAGHRPDLLSGGEKQRFAVARAIVHRPALVLADEPTANLDTQNATHLIGLMRSLNASLGITFLFSTHDQRLLDRAARIVRLYESGTYMATAVVPELERKMGFNLRVTNGRDLAPADSTSANEALIGSGLARSMNVQPGDSLTLLAIATYDKYETVACRTLNTLNSISSLIPEDPRRAEAIVGRLAALLRFSLDAGAEGLVPLAQEIRIVRDYLEIEKARFGDRLRYLIDVPRDLESARVPPLAVQTLVENSVKHAIAPCREGGEVRVSARAAANGVELVVSDTGKGFRLEQAPPGHGIANLASRLNVLFGDAAGLSSSASDGRPAVRLIVPLEAATGA